MVLCIRFALDESKSKKRINNHTNAFYAIKDGFLLSNHIAIFFHQCHLVAFISLNFHSFSLSYDFDGDI